MPIYSKSEIPPFGFAQAGPAGGRLERRFWRHKLANGFSTSTLRQQPPDWQALAVGLDSHDNAAPEA